jgi:hypothetical protein
LPRCQSHRVNAKRGDAPLLSRRRPVVAVWARYVCSTKHRQTSDGCVGGIRRVECSCRLHACRPVASPTSRRMEAAGGCDRFPPPNAVGRRTIRCACGRAGKEDQCVAWRCLEMAYWYFLPFFACMECAFKSMCALIWQQLSRNTQAPNLCSHFCSFLFRPKLAASALRVGVVVT